MARLDSELIARGIAGSRERAKNLIKEQSIFVNKKLCTKPSFEVSEKDEITSILEDIKYVGRGGLKLEKALREFNIDLNNKVCLDIGASTGGFTDCMLQNGADKVFAVDVGHSQLAEKLINDNRVVNMEGTDIRNLTKSSFSNKEIDFISIDVSFISLTQILYKAKEFVCENGIISALIKPQFEAGRQNIGKNGIVKDRKVHLKVLENINKYAIEIGLFAEKYIPSPVKGGSGNIEYLVIFSKSETIKTYDFKSVVEQAFNEK